MYLNPTDTFTKISSKVVRGKKCCVRRTLQICQYVDGEDVMLALFAETRLVPQSGTSPDFAQIEISNTFFNLCKLCPTPDYIVLDQKSGGYHPHTFYSLSDYEQMNHKNFFIFWVLIAFYFNWDFRFRNQ
ncbi:hypothetical protein NQ315_005070 [Exocentrus adspersus]|uniref:Uncharacterized protein n=1 Tax=Exocentrus adspersus TaxID=1586481 RepID=A0AAV8VQT4_9CUCU|nr:hypothetical protein NQ315_005070 [Exocentrus adspersus]